MVVTRSSEPFVTRLHINGINLQTQEKIVHIRVIKMKAYYGGEHISEICKWAYQRLKMLTKLKYVGVYTEDLVELYTFHIRRLT